MHCSTQPSVAEAGGYSKGVALTRLGIDMLVSLALTAMSWEGLDESQLSWHWRPLEPSSPSPLQVLMSNVGPTGPTS